MKNLIIVGHPNKDSFCYNGIFETVKNELDEQNQETKTIDLYRDSFTRPRSALIKKYIHNGSTKMCSPIRQTYCYGIRNLF